MAEGTLAENKGMRFLRAGAEALDGRGLGRVATGKKFFGPCSMPAWARSRIGGDGIWERDAAVREAGQEKAARWASRRRAFRMSDRPAARWVMDQTDHGSGCRVPSDGGGCWDFENRTEHSVACRATGERPWKKGRCGERFGAGVARRAGNPRPPANLTGWPDRKIFPGARWGSSPSFGAGDLGRTMRTVRQFSATGDGEFFFSMAHRTGPWMWQARMGL